MNREHRIYVAGHRGLVGSAIVRRLQAAGYDQLILRTRKELDLTDQAAVAAFFQQERPSHVFLAAARVGGIEANNRYRAEFIYENLAIEMNVIHAAWRSGVERLLFLGSSCIYPRDCPQPMREEHLLSGPLESTNEPYAIAKIAGIKLCEAFHDQYGCDFFSVMPTNLYGPGDNFDLSTSHVIPALLRKVHEASQGGAASVGIWGSGRPLREFLHVDDLADACLFLMRHESAGGIYNVGSGEEVSIRDLAQRICRVVGYTGELRFDASKPDGTPRKLLDSSRLAELGWQATVGLDAGLDETYRWYLEQDRNTLRGS